MKRLENKVAVITGGTEGMGFAGAKRFVEEGAYVFIVGRNQASLDKATELIGNNVYPIQGDISDMDDLDRIFATVKQQGKKIDILYANAGAAVPDFIENVTPERFDYVIGTNMRGTLFTVQKALPLFNDNGSIIIKGSIAGAQGRAGRSVYNASKAALRSFARTWANEFSPRGIRVNLLSPGPTETRQFAGSTPEGKQQMANQIPRKSLGRPEEIANVALFLASDESSFVNGIELFADGGMTQI
jgi:NAD(P)-dependent dehydrogenase (short-subunit alcohol dehydrogenase family)